MSDLLMPTYNLLSQPTPFIGRENELAEIADLLATPTCRQLTLVGPGGIGKTRLAIEAAHAIVDSPLHIWREGGGEVYFAPLQPLTTPDFIVSAIASALKFNLFGEGDPKTQLLHYLRDKHLLLVLDNFEHLLDGADLLPEILEYASGVKLLVTSRERLHLREEWVLDVRGLPFPQQGDSLDTYSATQLFVQHAHRAGYAIVDTDSPAIIHVCQLVEGMPLAIELAAAWARYMPCAEIARQIEGSLDILATNLRNVPDKHRSMRAVFDTSWKRLTGTEQAVFRKLSVFRGGFTCEAAEQVAGASRSALAALVDKSMLRVATNGRYDLHELMRQYADDQLERSGEAEAIRDAHCAYYAEFLEQLAADLKSANQIKALNEIEGELDNVRVGWRWAVAQGKEYEILQSLDSLALFYQIRSRFQEAAEAFGMAANRFADTENAVLGQTLMLQGWFAYQGGQRQKGRELKARGASVMRQIGFHGTMAMLFGSLNVRTDDAGDFQMLQQSYEDCLAIFRRTGDSWKTAWVLYGLGRLAYWFGKYQEAERLLQESLAIFRAIGDRWGSVYPIHTLGDWAMWRGDYRESRRFFEESLLINKEIGDIAGVAWSQSRLASIADSLEEFGTSIKYLAEILRIRFQFGSSWGSYEDELYLMARWLEAQGQHERAVEMFAFVNNSDILPFYELGGKVAQRLDILKAELPPEVFAVAVQRGEASNLETMALALRTQLAAWDEENTLAPSDAANDLPAEKQPLIEPLSERELEILHLIADGLNSREVAEHLTLSVGTIRWYLKQIYSKLDAHSRSQAIARARELHLLA
jgi:predicted ATPase/DNA-binding CsgD family transcriptional regulator